MVDLNIGNIVTIGLISVGGYALAKWANKASGLNLSWL